jgi:uncharacterized protein DUF4307
LSREATSHSSELDTERYGRKQPRLSRRWRGVLIIAGALAVGGVATWLAYENFGTAPIDTERVGFADLPANAMRLTFTVTRDQPDRPAVCIVRAQDVAGNESGRREVLISPGGPQTAISTVIQNARPPVTADVFGCSYQVPVYLSTGTRPTG